MRACCNRLEAPGPVPLANTSRACSASSAGQLRYNLSAGRRVLRQNADLLGADLCPALRRTVQNLRHGFVSLASTAGGREYMHHIDTSATGTDTDLGGRRERRRAASRPRACSSSRPCFVVLADLTMRRPAGLVDFAQNVAAAPPLAEAFEVFRSVRDAQPIAHRGRGSGRGALPTRRRRGRVSRGRPRGDLRRPRAGLWTSPRRRRAAPRRSKGCAAPRLGLPPSS